MVAFRALLALFPALLAAVSIFGILADPDDLTDQIQTWLKAVPADASRLIESQLTTIAAADNRTLGFAFATFAVGWAWIQYSWFASAYDRDDWVCRVATMVQMVGVLILALGPVSGAHFNPVVTLASWVSDRADGEPTASGPSLVGYVVAQAAGAVVGAVLANAMFGVAQGLSTRDRSDTNLWLGETVATAGLLLLAVWPDKPGHLGANAISIAPGSALVVETVLSALLMFVIMAVATDTRAVGAAAAIAIGGTVALDSLFGGGVTGASMNPARSFGPALVAGEWRDFWVYVIGPIGGALAGALAYELARGGRSSHRASSETT